MLVWHGVFVLSVNMNRVGFAIIFVISVFSLFGCGEKEHPTDAVLIENFNVHRGEFEELLQMFKADRSLGRVGDGFTRTASFVEKCTGPNAWNGKEIEVTKERLAAYEQLFIKLGLRGGIEGYCEKDQVVFIASSKGLAMSGSSKGYAHFVNPPKLIVDSLDTYRSPDEVTTFRHIDGNWYLYLY